MPSSPPVIVRYLAKCLVLLLLSLLLFSLRNASQLTPWSPSAVYGAEASVLHFQLTASKPAPQCQTSTHQNYLLSGVESRAAGHVALALT